MPVLVGGVALAVGGLRTGSQPSLAPLEVTAVVLASGALRPALRPFAAAAALLWSAALTGVAVGLAGIVATHPTVASVGSGAPSAWSR